MTQPLNPGWVDKPEPEQKRCFRVRQADVERSRKRGSARGARSRYALKNLPPVTDDWPEVNDD